MKKLINEPADVVPEMIEGLVASQPGLARLEDRNVILRSDLLPVDQRRVAVISGGGSGHEPAHAGYVGHGMLTAAVAGDVFTSPSVDAVLEAIHAAAGPAGALLIVKNYTGDRLNFGLAAEIARASGVPVEIVVVADDVALKNTVERERSRGLAGTILVHKIAGAAADAGTDLKAVTALAERAATTVRSMGVALGACTLPAAQAPGFELGDDEIEFGLGIHGEMGVERATMLPADRIVENMLARILEDFGERETGPMALLINGLGATSQMELMIVARHALAHLRERGVTVERVWVGNFMTALDMPGCSLSLMPLDAELSGLLEAPASAPAWPGGGLREKAPVIPVSVSATDIAETPIDDGAIGDTIRRVMSEVALALEEAEPRLTELDSVAGDGDLGASMVRGAEALRRLARQNHASPGGALETLASVLRREIAGSSGPFYAIALMRAARLLGDESRPNVEAWGSALGEAVSVVAETGGAKPGDRTMLDALSAARDGWDQSRSNGASGREAWHAAALGADHGAAATANMAPRLGRASYVGERALGHADAGARAVAVWMAAIDTALQA